MCHRRDYYLDVNVSRPSQTRLSGQPVRQRTMTPVGRIAELRWLKTVLDEAARGEPRAVFVRGGPGIGKSSLCRELLDQADAAGWQTIKVRCLQQATHPLAAFATELLPRLVQAGLLDGEPSDRDASVLSEALQAGLHPDVSTLPSDPSVLGPALARKVAQLADRRPLLALVDDAHSLDGGALSLFRDLVLALSDIARGKRVPVMLAVTIRDGGDPLPAADVLSRLLREPISRLLELDGLNEAEANQFVHGLTGIRCDPLLLNRLVAETGGNPLLLAESLRSFATRGVLVEQNGALGSNVDIEQLDIPSSAPAAFRDIILQLPAPILPIIEVAAVLGEEFSIDSLSASAEPSDIAEAVDVAARLGLFSLLGDRVQFSHSAIRQAVLETLGPVKRRRLHLNIAGALTERFGAAPEHILEVAAHLAAGEESPGGAETGVLFERAGDMAMAEFSWALGARYFLRVRRNPTYVNGLDAQARGTLLSKSARAYDNAGDSLHAREAFAEAIPYLREANSIREWGTALLGWERTFTNAGEPIPDSQPYDELRKATTTQTADVRAALLSQWAESLWVTRNPGDVVAAERAVEASLRLDDPQVRALAHATLGLVRMRHLEPSASLAAFREATRETRTIANPRVRGWGRAREAIPLIMLGRIEESKDAAERALQESRNGNDWTHSALNLAMLTVGNSILGDLPALRPAQAEAAMMINRSRNAQASFLRDGTVALDRLRRSQLDEAQDALASWSASAGRTIVRPVALLLQSATEGVDAVRATVAARPPYPRIPSDIDFSSLGSVCCWVEVAETLGSPELAEFFVPPLEAAFALGVEFSVAPPFLLSRVLGAAARLGGRYSQAEDYLRHALHVAGAARALPELALTNLEFTRLLVARNATGVGSTGEHLTAAMAIFRELGMTRSASEVRLLARSSGVYLEGFRFEVGLDELSTTEAEVLVEFARGLTVPQIAAQLLITERTVEGNLDRVSKRLGVVSRADAERFLARAPSGDASQSNAPTASSANPTSAVAALSPRETEVIGLIALGRTNQQIAEELVISLHTVARHVANIFDKTGAANRTEAARFAAKHP